jgi:hypothetical protein
MIGLDMMCYLYYLRKREYAEPKVGQINGLALSRCKG